jgi:hypothetical protein
MIIWQLTGNPHGEPVLHVGLCHLLWWQRDDFWESVASNSTMPRLTALSIIRDKASFSNAGSFLSFLANA